MNRFCRSIGSITVAWLIGSCGGGDGVVGPPPPTTAIVTLSSDTATLVPAAHVQLSATAKDASGQLLQRVFAWSTSDPAKVTVSTSGLLTGVAPGTASITAAVDGKSATATITVLDGGVVSSAGAILNLESGTVQLTVPADALATTTNLSVVASNATNGDPRAIKATAFDFGPTGTNFAKPVTIRIKYDPANLPPGATEQTLQLYLRNGVAWDEVAGSHADTAANVVIAPVSHFSTYAVLTPVPVASVSVSPATATLVAGSTQQLSAAAKDAGDNLLTGRAVAWTSTDPSIASVDASGLVTSHTAGSATITATSEGKSGASVITVTPAPVASVTVALVPTSITAVGTSQATATTLDANGATLTGRGVTWSSDNATVATVSSTGVVTAVAVGTANIIATSEGKTGSATLTVTPAPVATIVVNPTSASLVPGATTQLAAETRDAKNSVVTGRTIDWSTDAPGVATVSANGLVSAVSPGAATIAAASEGKTATASITVTPIPVATVSVSLVASSLIAGQTTEATATTSDANGHVLTGRTVVWSSDNQSVATVSSSGLVTAHSAGTAHVIAMSEGQTGSASLTVNLTPVASVTVSPPNVDVFVGSTRQLTAEMRDAGNTILDGRTVTWTSSDGSIATVSASGLVSGVAPGSATITAISEGKSATSAITVTPIPVASVTVALVPGSITAVGTSQAAATTLDANGATLTGRGVTWSSDNTTVATVSSTGVVTAVAVGAANIIATSEGKTGSATLTVTPAPVASITVSLGATSINSIQTTQATASLVDSKGRELTGRTIAWSSDNTAVASVSSTGLVTAVSAGTVNIVATSEGKAGSANLSVVPAPVASVAVNPATASMAVGFTHQLTAETRDAANNLLTGRAVTWTSSDPAVATVSTTGLVTGVAQGTATVTATSEGKSGTSSITVAPDPVASVAVSLSPTSITAVGTSQATAITLDASGVTLTGRSTSWSSDNTAVATVSAQGVVTAVGVGSAHIFATSEGKSGSATITVTEAPVASVMVSTPSTPMTVGGIQQLTATTKDAKGGVLSGRTVTWVSSNTAVLGVSASGNPATVTAVGVGTATITAMSESVSSSPTPAITVNPVPVATVALSAPVTPMIVGSTQVLTATPKDGGGSTLSGRTVSWVSSNPAVLSLSVASSVSTASGATVTITAVGVGIATITATSESAPSATTPTIAVNQAPVATVTVSTPTTPMVVGGTQQLTATVRDGSNNALTGRTVSWVSSNPAVLSVSPASGTTSATTVTAVTVGTATVTATSESVSSSPTPAITVNPVPVATVTLSTPVTPMIVGSTQVLTATPRDGGGNTLSGRTVNWVSSNPAVLSLSVASSVSTASGVTVTITAAGVGIATITATSESAPSATTPTVTVTPVPVATVTVNPSTASLVLGITQTQQLTAVTKDENGNVLTGRAVTWSSSNAAAATVDGTGLVTAVSAGSATITATSEGQSGTSSITVSVDPVATVTVSLAPSSITAVGTSQATATTLDANGNTLTGRGIDWSSDNTAVATVSSTGVVTGLAVGTANIVATSEGKTGSAPVTVTPAPVASISVSLAAGSINALQTTQATATLLDSRERVLTGRSIVWSSDNTGVATVSSAGLVTAKSPGGANIIATSEGKSGSAPITVTPAPVATVTVTPSSASLIVGVTPTQQLTAVTKDANGTVITGRTVTWTSSNGGVAAVDGNGLVTAVSAGGPVTITATSEMQSGTSSITVSLSTATGPLRKSSVNPRYFADQSGRVVYLTGSEYWNTLEDNGVTNPPRAFDFSAFLDFLQAHNHNFTRMYTWEQARWSSLVNTDHFFSPNPYMRTGPDTALDGGPKFDVTQLNPAYFARVRQRAIDAGARGIYVSIQLFDGWSTEMKPNATANNPWRSHPFNAANNINGINGDPNGDQSGAESHSLDIPAITVIQEAYVRAVIDAVNDLDNVIYEISNESDQSSDLWQYHMIQFIRDYEATKPKQHPVGMTVPYPTVPAGSNVDVLNSSADWMSLNGDINDPAAADGSKVSLNDTDHICGICGDPSWPWKNFTRGHNTLLMDGYDGSPGYTDPAYNPSDPKWEAIRKNMGYVRSYALRMDLAHALPRGDLVGGGFCLAAVGSEYLVFLPGGGNANLNLTGVSGTFTVEWFNPDTGLPVWDPLESTCRHASLSIL